MNNLLRKGLIIRGIGGLYSVESENGIVMCRARGRLRLDGVQPMIGDTVLFYVPPTGNAVINELCQRKNHLIRPAVANIKTLIIIISEASPVTQVLLIDKVSAIAGYKGLDVLICINKCDLARGDSFFDIYTKAGYKVIRTSATTGEGIDELRELISDGIYVLTGNSGVGKSSLINKIDSSWMAETGELSERIGRGKQTTRHVELFKLKNGAYIADTPGFQSFDIEQMDLILKSDLPKAFIDFKPYLDKCFYDDCTHTNEPQCGIRNAVHDGLIAQSRYNSYTVLLNSMCDLEDWEIRKKLQKQ